MTKPTAAANAAGLPEAVIALGNDQPDQALIAADAEHAKTWRIISTTAHSDAEIDAGSDALALIEERMRDTRAETIEGMRAKARTLLRLLGSETGDDDISLMAKSLARDLIGDEA